MHAYGSPDGQASHAGPSSWQRGGGPAAAGPADGGSVPDVPGDLVDEFQTEALRVLVSRLCHLKHNRFPGAQPVSFTRTSLDMLKQEDFWVCEKSDGQRVLMLIAYNKRQNEQEVYLIDRKNVYRRQHQSLFFPFHEIPPSSKALQALGLTKVTEEYAVRKDTLLDGELVWDVDRNGVRRMRLLLFDCIVLDGTSMSHRPLHKRYARLNQLILPPFQHYMRNTPMAAQDAPFEVKVKPMELAYGIRSVLHKVTYLEHGNDGLIFTCLDSGYVSGTDPKIIKWKPPYENTIDFMLRLRFPPNLQEDPDGGVPDWHAKPFFQLDEFMGGNRYRYFDFLYVEDEEWERMKESGVQFDDRVVECYWDPTGGPVVSQPDEDVEMGREGGHDEPNGKAPTAVRGPGWRLHRIRDDKHDGNHTSVVQKIIQSIMDGVEEDELVQADDVIRACWKSKEREERRKLLAATVAQNTLVSRRRGPPAPMRGTPPAGLNRR